MEALAADVLIIGAGPAGCATATILAELGHTVRVLERNAQPGHRVCGGFLSPEVVPCLEQMGLARGFRGLGPRPLHRVRVHHQDRSVERPLPAAAYGLTRDALDPFLCDAARAAGAQVLFQHEARSVRRESGRWRVVVEDHRTRVRKELTGRVVVLAGGVKRPGRLQADRTPGPPRWLAFQGVVPDPGWGATLELYFFDAGYLGLAPVEGGRVNLCGLIDVRGQRGPRTLADQLERWRAEAGPFREPLWGRDLPDRFRTCSPRALGRAEPVRDGVLFVGDAAGCVHPFCGDGIAMALTGAQVLADLVHAFLTGRIPARELESRYRDRWRRQFAGRIRSSRVLEQVRRSRPGRWAAVRVLERWPALLDVLFRLTRGGTE